MSTVLSRALLFGGRTRVAGQMEKHVIPSARRENKRVDVRMNSGLEVKQREVVYRAIILVLLTGTCPGVSLMSNNNGVRVKSPRHFKLHDQFFATVVAGWVGQVSTTPVAARITRLFHLLSLSLPPLYRINLLSRCYTPG